MRRLWRFLKNRKNWPSILLISAFLILAIAAPAISPVDEKDPGPFKQIGRGMIDKVPYPPSSQALLGTLPGQYDIYHSLVWGTRDALGFGLFVAFGSSIIGILFGVIAGYAGGHVNSWMMRFADAFLTFPPLAGVVFLQQMVDITKIALSGAEYYNLLAFGVSRFNFETSTPLLDFLTNVDPLLIILIMFSWMPYARLVNSLVLTLKQAEFIQAAKAVGGGPLWIIRKHLIPNSISPAVVLAARDVGNAVIIQATFTFIGLGGDSPWGTMLAIGRDWVIGSSGSLFTYWWTYLPVTIAVILYGISWNLLGDGINDALDPHVLTQIDRPLRKKRKKDDLSEIKQIPVIAFTPVKREVDPVLETALNAMEHKDLEIALHAFSHLIKHGRELDGVIVELIQVLRNYPQESQLWRLLGDALARNGEVENATRAYEQAEKLLH